MIMIFLNNCNFVKKCIFAHFASIIYLFIYLFILFFFFFIFFFLINHLLWISSLQIWKQKCVIKAVAFLVDFFFFFEFPIFSIYRK